MFTDNLNNKISSTFVSHPVFNLLLRGPLRLPFFIYFINFADFLDWTSPISDLSIIILPHHLCQYSPNPLNADCFFAVLLKIFSIFLIVESYVCTYPSFSLTLLHHLRWLGIPSFLERSFFHGFHNPFMPWFAFYPSDLFFLILFMDCIIFSNDLNTNHTSKFSFFIYFFVLWNGCVSHIGSVLCDFLEDEFSFTFLAIVCSYLWLLSP